MRPDFGIDQGFAHYEVFDWQGLDVIGPRVIDWLNEHVEENFLLLIHTDDVHAARSLLPLMRGEEVRELPAFSESPAFGNRRAIALGGHHLIGALEQDHIELLEFRRDPLELREIAAEHPTIATRLRSLAKRWQDELDRRGRPDAESPTLDEETAQNLRALGYLN